MDRKKEECVRKQKIKETEFGSERFMMERQREEREERESAGFISLRLSYLLFPALTESIKCLR